MITNEELRELIKCMDDVEYFIETYVKRLDVNEGYVPVVLNDFQKEAIKDYKEKRSFCKMAPRQKGKTFIASCILLHVSLFQEYQTSAVIGYNMAHAQRILETISDIYDQLPDFMKSKITTRNKSKLEFDTNSMILAVSANSNALKGRTINNLYIDESDYIQNVEEIIRAFYPCIASMWGSRLFAFTTSRTQELFRAMEYSK